MKEIIQGYVKNHIETAQGLLKDLPDIAGAAGLVIAALRSGNKLLVAGNGGSVADAYHFAAELVGRYKKERKALPAVSLDANPSSVTAIANDYAFEKVFARQVEALAKPGDVFFGISTSGNSKNILEAIKVARNQGCKVVGLTGKTGGEMAKACDFLINIPAEDTPRVQEMHTLVIHILSALIEDELSK